MKLEIPIAEIQEYIKENYRLDIDLRNTKENRIRASYFDSVDLIIENEVRDNVIQLKYEADGLTDLIAKTAHFFMKKKLEFLPVAWNSKQRQVTIDLKKIKELTGFLNFIQITEISFLNDAVRIDMHTKK